MHPRARSAAIAAVCSSMLATAAYASTVASWLMPVDGQWSEPAKWSTAPQFPNNDGSNTFAVVVDVPGTTYNIMVAPGSANAYTVDSLSVNAAAARLYLRPGTLATVNGLSLESGVVNLWGGTLRGTVEGGGGELTTIFNSAGTFDAVTLRRGINVVDHSTLYLTGDLQLDGGTIALDGDGINNRSLLSCPATETISGSGTIILHGASVALSSDFASTLTIGNGITIRTGSGVGSQVFSGAGGGGAFVNFGTISAQSSSASISFLNAGFTNAGTLSISNGSAISIKSNAWQNTGTIVVGNGTLTLGGTFGATGLDSIVRAGDGTVELTGTALNTGHLLDLARTGSIFMGAPVLELARIQGGSLVNSGGSSNQLIVNGRAALDGVSIDAPLAVPANARLALTNSWTSSAPITINGGTLSAGGTLTIDRLSTITRSAGTFELAGTFENTGQTLVIGPSTGTWYLNGGTIRGGTVSAVAGGGLEVGFHAGGILEDVTLATDVTVWFGGVSSVRNALHLSQSAIRFRGGEMQLVGNAPIDGDGTILFMGNAEIYGPTTSSINIGQGVSVVAATTNVVGTVGRTTIPMTFNGTVLASNSAEVDLAGSTAVNHGTLRAAQGGRFFLLGNWSNDGTLRSGSSGVAGALGSLTNSGTIDIGSGFIFGSAIPQSTVELQIRNARNNGSWDGIGITSSEARADPNHATTLGVLSGAQFHVVQGSNAKFFGLPIDNAQTLVKYTYYGDTDFNGVVNFDDYVRADNGFNNHLTGWLNGDFDLNGQVNFDDYVLIDLAFNTQSGTLRRALAFLSATDGGQGEMDAPALQKVQRHAREWGEAYARALLAAVPEPAGCSACAGLAYLLIGRRRRSRRAVG